MKADHVKALAFWSRDGKLVLADAGLFQSQLKKMGFGFGEALVLRVERQDDAAKHGSYKHLFGHYLKPVSDVTGYTVTELKADMKARFLPDGMTSLTDMNKEQFEEFNRSVEQCIREEFPSECWDACANAMALYDRMSA